MKAAAACRPVGLLTNEMAAVQWTHGAPGGLPALSGTTLFYLFLLAVKPRCLRLYIFNKDPFFSAAVGTWHESRRQTSDRTPVERLGRDLLSVQTDRQTDRYLSCPTV